jgi:ribosome-binding protein aMBF1 (putative translation factor)
MSGRSLDDLHKEWLKKRPGYKAAYDALEEEFAIISALIEARERAGLTQAQVAKRMKTTQTVVARLESGRTRPSTRTLERFAKATGSKLRIILEPDAGSHATA